MKPGFHLWMLKPKSSQSSGCTHTHQTSWKCLNKCYVPRSQIFYLEDGGDTFLWNVGLRKIYTGPHPEDGILHKQTLSSRKLMATVFWDMKGVLMVEFMQQDTTIMSWMYCETLKKLCRAIQNKRRGMLTYGIVLFHDNAWSHTTDCNWILLEHFNRELFNHPPYSPDLTPSDYHLFAYLKNLWDHSPSTIMSWWKVSKHDWAHRQQTSLTQAYKNLFPDKTSASIPAVITLRSSLRMQIFLYIIIFSSNCLF
jgi:histone-lysine N-methyltransferase SETMAR